MYRKCTPQREKKFKQAIDNNALNSRAFFFTFVCIDTGKKNLFLTVNAITPLQETISCNPLREIYEPECIKLCDCNYRRKVLKGE